MRAETHEETGMSEDFDKAVEVIREKAAGSGLEGRYKFEIEGEGVILIDNGSVSTEDGEADVTISAPLETFREMFEGDLAPTAAFMTGKIRIEGDMGAAMKLSSLIG
jgi:putative sterol carrier protein